MPKHISTSAAQAPREDGHEETTPQLLMRILLGLTGSPKQRLSHPPDDELEQVLLDVDFDGVRYLLIKMPAVERKHVQLSPRELEIVRMVAQGHQNKIIAVVLNISAWTVCTHLRRIFAKLGVNSRAAMVARLSELSGIADQKVHLLPNGYPSRAPALSHASEAGAGRATKPCPRPDSRSARRRSQHANLRQATTMIGSD